jgi:hypothetical protein
MLPKLCSTWVPSLSAGELGPGRAGYDQNAGSKQYSQHRDPGLARRPARWALAAIVKLINGVNLKDGTSLGRNFLLTMQIIFL